MVQIRKPTSAKVDTQMNVILDMIKGRYKENRFPPSVREICSVMGYASTSTAHRYLKLMAERGMIILVPGVNRGIMLPPEDDTNEGKTDNRDDTERGERYEDDQNEERDRRAV